VEIRFSSFLAKVRRLLEKKIEKWFFSRFFAIAKASAS